MSESVKESPVQSTTREADDPPGRRSLCRSSIGPILMLLLLVSAFLAGFGVSMIVRSKEDGRIEKTELRYEEQTETKKEAEPEIMSCEWLRQCRKKRPGTPPLLVISADGFARSYLSEKETPTVLKMGECGGRAEYLRPSFPTKTYPNHYTIATGLHPGSHGIVDNRFSTNNGTIKFDQTNGSFYGGEPIWNTAVKHGKTSEAHMWLGSYAAIGGLEASFHYNKWRHLSLREKIDNVTDRLISDSPPDLTMLYLERPDVVGHTFGKDSPYTREAVSTVDAMLRYALVKLHDAGALGCINIVFLSDHGLRHIDNSDASKTLHFLEDYDASLATAHIQSEQANVFFYENHSLAALKGRKGAEFRLYRSAEELPLRYHYTHEHIGFPLLCGNPGTTFLKSRQEIRDKNLSEFMKDQGNHGWDNLDEQMQAIFFTHGPSFRRNVTLPPFQNTELYNLFADLLGIPAAANDGMAGLLDGFLTNPPQRVTPLMGTKPCEGTSSPASVFHLASGDPGVCSRPIGSLFVLQSSNQSIAFEFLPSSTAVTQAAVDFVRREFRSSPLIERAILRLAGHSGIRIQVGRFPSLSRLLFASGFWCDNETAMGRQCAAEENTRTEAYAVPEGTEENFNDLPLADLLFDNRVSIADIERATSLLLLPREMDPATRRRVAVLIANSKWK